MLKLAILDDYQNVALKLADWSVLNDRAEITRFEDNEADLDRLVARLRPFDIVTTIRERTPMPRKLIEALPNLKLLATTGMYNRAFDLDACDERGVHVCGTRSPWESTTELTWAMILAMARKIVPQAKDMEAGKWETVLGLDLNGSRLGIVGLGKIGTQIAVVGKAFGMDVVAWSPNLTEERCRQVGVTWVSREDLFRSSDFISLHMALSERTLQMVGAADFALMKPSAYFVNTSRGPLIDQEALTDVLLRHAIAGAGLDVFDTEPLPPAHKLRSLDNTLILPHLGYVTERQYRIYYEQTVENVAAFLNGERIRPLNRPVS